MASGGYGGYGQRGGGEPKSDHSAPQPPMTFAEAKDFRLVFGKHKGGTLNEVATDDDGLLYLDWLVGNDWVNGKTRAALEGFLGHEPVARDVARLVEAKQSRGK